MSNLTNIIYSLLGIGFVGNLILYWKKRHDEQHDSDKVLLSPIIDELCKVCSIAEEIIERNSSCQKTISELRAKELRLFKEANSIMSRFNSLLDELMTICSQDVISASEQLRIKSLRNLCDSYIKKRSELMNEALSESDVEKQLIVELNSFIQSQVEQIKGIPHRLTNAYKFSNSKSRKLVHKELSKIDNVIKRILERSKEHPTHLPLTPLLFQLYKSSTDSRYNITNLNG
ncbi:MAG: hypothetical protein NC391_07865 [Alistipes timonensis]|nr:hypothetical protein [Alistipes timonensis]